MTRPGIEPRSPGAIGEHSNHYANAWYKISVTYLYYFHGRAILDNQLEINTRKFALFSFNKVCPISFSK